MNPRWSASSSYRPDPATAAAARRGLRSLADPVRARRAQRYFRTGPGEYGEGDRFLGVTVPGVRSVARASRGLPPAELARLVRSPVHEERLLALLVLVDRFRRSRSERERRALHRFYLQHLDRVNNWDLVDLTAPDLLGAYLEGSRALVDRLSRSSNVWHRRISILAHAANIRRGQAAPTLRFLVRFLEDEHDLVHKAAGWMLREVGQRADERALRAFLDRNAARMPRTMLRYAIEKFPARDRAHYMDQRTSPSSDVGHRRVRRGR